MPPTLRSRLLAPALLGVLGAGPAMAQAPVIKSVSVSYSIHRLTISGANFGATPTVTFGGQSLTPTITSPGIQMTVTVPSSFAPATYALSVGTPSGSAASSCFYGPSALAWKGAWSPSTSYAANDVVSWNGGSYLSHNNANLNHQPDLFPANWNVLSAPPAPITLISQGGTQTGSVRAVGLHYIIALQGIYPVSDSGGTYNDIIVGEVRMFAGTFAPKGWAFCEGQLLQISGNETLFTLIGTLYGGDGISTFALPDLRAAVPMDANQ